MAVPSKSKYVIVGAGIHGLSTAYHLARILKAKGRESEAEIIVLDKGKIGAGASGIACGIVRNNYFQPAMRELMAHSVKEWESDPKTYSYHPTGYMQLSPEVMHEDIVSIYDQQQNIGYQSALIEGAGECDTYLKGIFSDWQGKGITTVLHEKQGGFANNMASLHGLAAKAREAGVTILEGVTVTGFGFDQTSDAVSTVMTDQGNIECEYLVIGVGPWVRDFWNMLDLPNSIPVTDLEGKTHPEVPMWRFWQLEEGVLDVASDFLRTNEGNEPPVIHLDTDAPLYSQKTGNLICEDLWGVYFKPDLHFGGVQGGAMPYKIETQTQEVALDPYGPKSPEFVASAEFVDMWTSSLAFCLQRFEGKHVHYRNEKSGGLGCFTPDSFPVFDVFRQNCYVIADSNHGYKMLGVGELVAEEVLGQTAPLLEPFRISRFATGELHPVSNSPYPWS
ncbi:MAG: FAD-binding oxidoreductase [Devosiaceae bacterium]|nr:FAD-binding oxidoreductase [Devosiaceae bacterium]